MSAKHPISDSMIGKVFGRFTVLSYAGKKNYHRLYNCKCECGTIKNIIGSHLTSGNTRSCGCLGRDESIKRFTKHGHMSSGHRSGTYRSWGQMKARCYLTKLKCYYRYGGRGITVCDRWRESFAAFLEDMGERPAGTSLDRIDNAGNYEPGNCRWSSSKEQARNTRNNSILTHDGRSQCIAAWAEEFGIDQITLRRRIVDGGWSVSRAITTPVRQHRVYRTKH